MSRTIVTTSAAPPPAPNYHTLPADPVVADAKQVPEDGRVSIDGHEWRFVNVLSIRIEKGEVHVVGVVPGQRPEVYMPTLTEIGGTLLVVPTGTTVSMAPACSTSGTIDIGYATIEETPHKPIVFGPLGRVMAGKA